MNVPSLERVQIGKSPIDIAQPEAAACWVLNRMRNSIRTAVAPTNAATVVMTSHEAEYREIIDCFDLVLADGFWPAKAASCLYLRRVPHANTLPFLRSLFEQAEPGEWKVFLLGAQPEVVQQVAKRLPMLHPNTEIVGYAHGYFSSEEEKQVVRQINESGANLLLLGISSPKKEWFIYKYWNRLQIKASVGVGGLFDILAERTSEAPEWIRNYGFEWLYRFCQEPRRMLKRYTLVNAVFIGIVLKQMVAMVCRRPLSKPLVLQSRLSASSDKCDCLSDEVSTLKEGVQLHS